MTVELTTYEGKGYRLPEPLAYRFEYACGTPCDSLWLEAAARQGDEEIFPKATRLRAWEKGEVVFTGVVDEIEWGLGPQGRRVSISGRSMAALLLDNEALAADYGTATLEDILRDHVTPYGIQVGRTGDIPACRDFSVSSGQSEWQVVYNFARYHGGVPPRFDREGRLTLAPFEDGGVKVLGEDVPLTGIVRAEKRYGVLSEVLVRDKGRKTVERVADPDFLAQGGRCRRVVTMNTKSTVGAMRYSARFQMEKARAGRRALTLSVPRLFLAWPGELVRVDRAGWNGLWRVLETVVEQDSGGGTTKLKLGDPAAVI